MVFPCISKLLKSLILLHIVFAEQLTYTEQFLVRTLEWIEHYY